jgi:hypothetical protein
MEANKIAAMSATRRPTVRSECVAVVIANRSRGARPQDHFSLYWIALMIKYPPPTRTGMPIRTGITNAGMIASLVVFARSQRSNLGSGSSTGRSKYWLHEASAVELGFVITVSDGRADTKENFL